MVWPAAPPTRADSNDPSGGPLGNAVTHRVLDKRLNEKGGDLGTLTLSRHVVLDAQPIPKSDLFDGKISSDKFEFVRQRYELRFGVVERFTQQFAQPTDHLHDLVRGAATREHRNGVHGIEQKVRIELRTKGV